MGVHKSCSCCTLELYSGVAKPVHLPIYTPIYLRDLRDPASQVTIVHNLLAELTKAWSSQKRKQSFVTYITRQRAPHRTS